MLGTYGYDGNAKGATPWERMVPLGLQWGNNPKVTFAETCQVPNGPCDYSKLTEQWINEQAVKDLATPPLNFNHLGFGGRLAGPVDNPKSLVHGLPSDRRLPERADPAGIRAERRAAQARCPGASGDRTGLAHDVFRQ